MDVFGLVLEVADVIETLYRYGKAVKHSKEDISQLCNELCALQAILDRIGRLQPKHRQQDDDDESKFVSSPTFQQTIQDTGTFIKALQKKLLPKDTSLKRAVQALKWPFSDDEVKDQRRFLERVKSTLTLGLMGDVAGLSTSLLSEFHGLRALVGQMYEETSQNAIEDRLSKLRQRLTVITPSTAHVRACSAWREFPTTGKWFFNKHFPHWSTTSDMADSKVLPCRTMWLKGRSGAGKSTLFSHCVEQIKQDLETNDSNNISLAYFYCSFSEEASQSWIQLLASLVVQLSFHYPGILEIFFTNGNVDDEKSADPVVLRQAIVEAASSAPTIMLMIDAINEMKQAPVVLDGLGQLLREASNIHIFITSTPEVNTDALSTTDHSLVEVSMTSEAIADDVQTFVTARLQSNATMRSLKPERRDKLQQQLTGQAGGMFRWVQCQVDHLSTLHSGRDVSRALERLPPDLNTTYTAILQRIPDNVNKVYAREAMLWLTYAMTPLTVSELADALLIEDDMDTLDDDERFPDLNWLLEMCRGLIELNPQTGTIGLAHFSVKKFLTEEAIHTDVADFALDEKDGQRLIVRKCLTYLMFNDFEYKIGRDSQTLFSIYPFLQYASTRWAMHAASITDATTNGQSIFDIDLILKFFHTFTNASQKNNFTFWVSCLLPDDDPQVIAGTEPLYYAASYGLTPVVAHMLSTSTDIDARGGRSECTALQVAAYRGHMAIVRTLLEHGADPNTTNFQNTGPLFWARRNGFNEVGDLLERYGAVAGNEGVRRTRSDRERLDEEIEIDRYVVGLLDYTPAELSPEERNALWLGSSRPGRGAGR